MGIGDGVMVFCKEGDAIKFCGVWPPKEKRPCRTSSVFIFLFVLLALFMGTLTLHEDAYSPRERGVGVPTEGCGNTYSSMERGMGTLASP